MKLSNSITDDLLLLVKGHYGPYTDRNMREQMARLFERHYLVGIKTTRTDTFQAHVLGQTIAKVAPSHFLGDADKVARLLTVFAEAPDKGIRELASMLGLLRVDGLDPNIPVITLPQPDPQIAELLAAPYVEET